MKIPKTIAGFYSKHKKPINLTGVAVAVFLILTLILNLIFPLPLYKIEDDYSILHLDSGGNLVRITLSESGKYRIKMNLDGISEYVKKGFIEYEDRTYWYNPAGVNPFSIARAAFLNVKKGRIVSGGSTIAMQVAKLIEPKKKRTFGVKIQEAFRAMQLEARYSKKELLEIYLNTIPLGGNIEGVAAASYFYFNKPPAKLSLGEAALLIALPKQPNKLRPDRHLTEAYAARDAVLVRVAKALKLGGDVLTRSLEEKYPGKRFINPHNLPHLVNRNFKGEGYIRHYFIDAGMQAMAEDKLKNTVLRLKKFGIYNGAIIITENKTNRVIAYAGSPDFNDKEHAGEIDGANIYRSPGSTLKGLLYGLALDAGLITPKKIVYDIPIEYDGYNPVNAQKAYFGLIPAQEGLRHSYNSIAVALEFALKKKGLLYTLKRCGFTDMKRNNIVPGLSVVLGTYPMTLEELVQIFSGLSNNGEMRRLKYTFEQEKIPEKPVKLLSKESAYAVSEMLAGGERPDLPQSWEFTYYRGKVAFKTGTSFGLVDALCVGYTPDYTVGVWLGNADASPSHELVGIRSAAPLLMEIFNVLSRHRDSWYVMPDGTGMRKICVVSGDMPGPFCTKTTEDIFIKSATKKIACSVHKQIYVNKKTGLRADPAHLKLPENMYENRIVEDWPPEAAAFLRQTGGLVSEIPPYGRDEAPDGSYAKPKITSPVQGNVYILNAAMPEKFQKIPLKVAAAGGAESKVFWFANGKVVAEGPADKVYFFKPEPGEWEVAVQDAAGESDSVKFKVFEQ